MTKQELLDLLASKLFCDFVGDSTLQETKPWGDKWYFVNIREVAGNACVYRNIHYYVIDEGGETERAYFKDSEPTAQLVVSSGTGA